MNNRLLICGLVAVFACFGRGARADLLVTYQTRLSGKPIDSMLPSEAKHMVEHEMQSTIRVRGAKTRVDILYLSYIIDSATRKAWILNNTGRTYSVVRYDPADPGWFVPTLADTVLGPGHPAGYSVIDKGKSVSVSGIACREYGLSAVSAGTGPVSRMKSVVDTTVTLPVRKFAITPFGDYGLGHLPGIPVLVSTTMTGGPTDGASVEFEASRISTEKIDDSDFEIPAGFSEMREMPVLYLPNPLGGPTMPSTIHRPH